MKKTIPEILINLPSRDPEEQPQSVPYLPGLPYQIMILGQDSDGYSLDDLIADLENLQAEGWVENWTKVPREDGYGHYLSVLINQSQGFGIISTNIAYRLFERSHLKAMTKASLPSWAKKDGQPSHTFWGQSMPDDDGYGN